VKDVLAQTESNGAIEVKFHRSEIQFVTISLFGGEFEQLARRAASALRESVTGREGSGVPHVPHGLVELRGCLTSFE